MKLAAGWGSLALLLACPHLAAQKLVPRAYWPAPNGTNLMLVGYQYTTGDVVTDPTLPISGVDSRGNRITLGYQRTFSLFGRTANAQVFLPWVDASTSGFVEGEFRSRQFSEFTDPQL